VLSLTRSDGSEVVIERRVGYDSVLISDALEAGSRRIFRYVSKDPDGFRLLHTLSVPKASGAAELAVSDRFEIDMGSPARPARLGRTSLRCSLYPTASTRRLDTTRAVE
jgi:hypothetical protein